MSPLPENYVAGLQLGPKSATPTFSVGKREADPALAFMTETVLSLLQAEAKLPKAAATIKFVSYLAGKHPAGLIIDIAVSQLFDTTLITMLEAIGDTAMVAAVTELRLALQEPTADGKRYHRGLADGHFGTVYAAAKRLADKRRWLDLTDSKTKGHRDAASAAMLKALISHDAGLQATRHWVTVAQQHFTEYDARSAEPRRGEYRRLQVQLAELRSGTSWLVYHPLQTPGPQGQRAHIRRSRAVDLVKNRLAEVEREVGVVDRTRAQFFELCQCLA